MFCLLLMILSLPVCSSPPLVVLFHLLLIPLRPLCLSPPLAGMMPGSPLMVSTSS